MSDKETKTKVLIADDDMSLRLILRTSLEAEGYEVIETEDGNQALEKLNDDPEIRFLITDLIMPEIDGFDLIRKIRKTETRYTYIIVLTSNDDTGSLLKALSLGADDYLAKPVLPEELKLRLRGGTRLLRLESHEELIFSMAKLADYRSEETGFHLERIIQYTRLLARDISKCHPEAGLSFNTADEFSRVSPLHDLGKVAIPDNILHKPGKLTLEEFEIMKTHSTIGGNLIKEIYDKTGSPYLNYAHQIAMYHHERWNGNGYPFGLAGNAIPLPARIVALADVYDAITSKRCYKDAAPHEQVKKIILAEKGEHFDPIVVDSFLRIEELWLGVKEQFLDEP